MRHCLSRVPEAIARAGSEPRICSGCYRQRPAEIAWQQLCKFKSECLPKVKRNLMDVSTFYSVLICTVCMHDGCSIISNTIISNDAESCINVRVLRSFLCMANEMGADHP